MCPRYLKKEEGRRKRERERHIRCESEELREEKREKVELPIGMK